LLPDIARLIELRNGIESMHGMAVDVDPIELA